jgi:hypothetical protein
MAFAAWSERVHPGANSDILGSFYSYAGFLNYSFVNFECRLIRLSPWSAIDPKLVSLSSLEP